MIVMMNEEPSIEHFSKKQSKSWLGRLLSTERADDFSLDTLRHYLSAATLNASIDTETVQMLHGVINITQSTVQDIMVPRAKVVAIQAAWPFERILKAIIQSGHSRFPVFGEDEDEVIGILLAKDLLTQFNQDQPDIQPLLRPVQFVPEGTAVTALLHNFLDNRSHLSIVVDEYGDIAGLVTIEDVFELIVGNIQDEHDKEEEVSVKKVSENKYLIDAFTTIPAFNQYFNTQFSDEDVDTIGGLLIETLGRLPKDNEEIYIDQFCFVVKPFDGKKLALLEVLNHVPEAQE